MYGRNQMMRMDIEELNKIALQKDKIGNATQEAYLAQEIIWERRFYSGITFVDEYTGERDTEAEEEFLDAWKSDEIYHFDNDKW